MIRKLRVGQVSAEIEQITLSYGLNVLLLNGFLNAITVSVVGRGNKGNVVIFES